MLLRDILRKGVASIPNGFIILRLRYSRMNPTSHQRKRFIQRPSKILHSSVCFFHSHTILTLHSHSFYPFCSSPVHITPRRQDSIVLSRRFSPSHQIWSFWGCTTCKYLEHYGKRRGNGAHHETNTHRRSAVHQTQCPSVKQNCTLPHSFLLG